MFAVLLFIFLFISNGFALVSLGISTQYPSSSKMFEIEQFLGKRLGFREMYMPFLCTQGDFETIKDGLQSIYSVNAIPILRIDPSVPNPGPDSMTSIKLGLYDSSINAIFSFLEGVLSDADNRSLILIFGSGCNSPSNIWGLDPAMFVGVYQKFVSMAASYNLIEKISFGLSLDPSIYDYENVVVTDPDDPSKVINEYVRLFIDPQKGQLEPKLYFPGNNFVNWMTFDCYNSNVDKWEWADECVKKGIALIQMVEPRKPSLAFIGTPTPSDQVLQESSQGNNDIKIKLKANWYNKGFKQLMKNPDDILVPLKGIILNNRDSNLDIGFYDTLLGDTKTAQSNSQEKQFYTYSILPTIMTAYNSQLYGNINEIKEADSNDKKNYNVNLSYTVAFSGLCSAGYHSVSNECVPCEAGTYSLDASTNCVECRIGYYNDETGKSSCKECPTGTISISTGSRLEEYCICKWNYYNTNKPEETNSTKPICVKCPLNYYSSGGSSECKECPKTNKHKSKDETLVGCKCKSGKVYNVLKDQCVSIEDDAYVAAQYGYLPNDENFSLTANYRSMFKLGHLVIIFLGSLLVITLLNK